MKVESPASKPRRAVSSVEVAMFGAATSELARRPMTASARSVGPCSSSTCVGPLRIDVPADSMSWLAHTVRPS